ncbi:lyase family protein [Aldersonia kunmingensis]|uniref:lyase family protein n=1 Tax=Aldersonia kunmingensis TaxID=408066 RepID=UPI00082F9767|nr:lyase family protein [Aldersonia kunmingensis]
MSDLLWPGDHRAGALLSDGAYLDALVAVENAWLAVLVDSAVAPTAATADLTGLVGAEDVAALAEGAEQDGNPVSGLVALLRDRAGDEPARWLHRGLTSQDVVDTALLLCLRDALDVVAARLVTQVQALLGLIEKHRDAPILAHTLTQPALPTTAGRKFSVWLQSILDAADALEAVVPLPVQVGGAAGTLAAGTELSGSAAAAVSLADALADRLGLARAHPWHTSRAAVTRIGDALVTCTDAWGHVANDISVGARAEIGEFAEGSGGSSSTMPHKNNPVLTVLLRRAALAAPGLGATLHAASAASLDERTDGGWHAEWATLRTLARRTVVAADQAADLLANLRFDTARAAANLEAAHGILAEQQTMAGLTGRPPTASYLGATDLLVETAVERGRNYLKGSS